MGEGSPTYARHATELASLLSNALNHIAGRVRRCRHATRRYRHLLQCPEAVADPYDLIRVPPEDVDYVMTQKFSYRPEAPPDHTYIIGGDWDRVVPDAELKYLDAIEHRFTRRRIVPLERYCFYRAVADHIRRGVPWEKTEFYEWLRARDDFPPAWEYSTEEGRQWRFEQLDRLAASMRAEGYRTQRECGEAEVSGHEQFGNLYHPAGAPPECHEVAVNVGRDGTLILDEGRHRLTVARALELPEIPVRVFVRHEQWQRKRSAVARAADRSEVSADVRRHLPHPDLADVAAFDVRAD